MSHCFPICFLFSNCFNAGFEPTGPRASFLILCPFLLSFFFLSRPRLKTINGAPSALLRPTRQNYSLRTIPVLSSSLGRKDDVALFFICSRRNSGKTLAARKKKKIIAVIRLSLGVSTFGQNCSPYAQHSSASASAFPVTARSVFDKSL